MERAKPQRESYFHEVFLKLKGHKLAVTGLFIWLGILLLVVILPPVLKLDPYTSDPAAFGAAPGAGHILGTDSIGRDLFSRLVYGGRTSLFVGLLSTSISFIVGIPLGVAAGYFRGWIEMLVMRLADIFMSFPSMILILVLVSIIGPSLWSVAMVIGVMGWTQFARLIYANVLSVSQMEYVESARAIGTSHFHIIMKYILPNAFAPILIAITFQTANAIILESALSFLGMGVQLPMASWGNMLFDARSYTVFSTKPWMWLPPGLCIIVTVMSINFFGDGIRDALDPKLKWQ